MQRDKKDPSSLIDKKYRDALIYEIQEKMREVIKVALKHYTEKDDDISSDPLSGPL